MQHAPLTPFFIQLSDPHIVAPGRLLMDRIDTAACLGRAIEQICTLPRAPSHVLITGDLVERGRLEEYAHLKALLSPLQCPCLLLPGNHDSVPKLRQAFADNPHLQSRSDNESLSRFVLYAADLGSHRLIALDTVVAGKPHGILCKDRLQWLDDQLQAQPERPTVVALHHPPFQTGIRHMDAMGLMEGAQAFEHIVSQHPQIERVLCGHLHRPIVRHFGRTVAMTAPSVAHQITLGLEPESEATYVFEPPGFYIHAVLEGQLVTHFQAIGDFGPPRHFS